MYDLLWKHRNDISKLLTLILILSFIFIIFPKTVYAVADRYWVNGTGVWSDTSHWSLASGGGGGASLPTNALSVAFDANSFTAPGQSVTIDVNANCLNMDWTGATNTPALIHNFAGGYLRIYGDLVFIPAMTHTKIVGDAFYFRGNLSNSLTFANTMPHSIVFGGGADTGTWTLQDDLTTTGGIYCSKSTLDTNNKTINCDRFVIDSTAATTITLGSSIVNTTGIRGWEYSGSNLTLTANTATINVAGTGTFVGGNITNYNNVNLNGTAHTVSGNNTYNIFAINTPPSTITFASNSLQTVNSFIATGTLANAITIKSSAGGSPFYLSDAASTNNAYYCSIKDSVAQGGATWIAYNSTNVSGNSGWNFPLIVSTIGSSNVRIDKDGNSLATLSGYLSDLGGETSSNVYFQYGTSMPMSTNTTLVAKNTLGVYSTNITGMTPSVYNFRAAGTNASRYSYGSNNTFIINLPTMSTVAASGIGTSPSNTATLNGNISNMNSATSCYAYFEWGYTPSYGSTTPVQTISAASAFSSTLTGLQPNRNIYYRAVVRNGVYYTYGGGSSFIVYGSTDYNIIDILPLAYLVGILITLFWLMSRADATVSMIITILAAEAVLGLIGFIILRGLVNLNW